MSNIFKSRSKYSGSNLLYDLQIDEMCLKKFCRMTSTDFQTLINLVGPRIERKNTIFRKLSQWGLVH